MPGSARLAMIPD